MASAHLDNPLSCHLGRSYYYLVIATILFLSISLPLETNSLSFEFPSFDKNSPGVDLQGNASISDSQIQLTTNQVDVIALVSYGRALYPQPIQLWDDSGTPKRKRVTDFTTTFTFHIANANSPFYGDGLTFLLVPENTQIQGDSYGGCLGLFSNNLEISGQTNCYQNQTVVAIEFDTFQNLPWDQTPLDHIGIDVNSLASEAYANVSAGLRNKTSHAFVSYNSTTKNLSVSLSMEGSSVPYSVSHPIDLSTVLPERIQVGFSAATGTNMELHQILDWSFSSTLEESVSITISPTQPPQPQQGETPTTPSAKKGQGRLVARISGIAVGISLILVFGVAIAWIILRRKSTSDNDNTQFDFGEDFDAEAGHKRFTYAQLSRATNNFSIQEKLGEGGFGDVYKGLLPGPGNREIAVKKIKSGSHQGKKGYIAEVKIISRLRHRNLVQLLGWCHGHGELLLVYEFMPNGSLDFHLFGRRFTLVPWSTRYKIALGLASALLYLHEEWEQSVIHRDIKSSNVMLDMNFNPKLGDFGLARLVDHEVDMQTTAPAGTPGYMAPECILTGKASKESDVYSFGIVALELACGRKVIEARGASLVQWVWELYGKGLILEAVDNRLEGEFDEEQARCLMVVGLWCSHPDLSYRPSIKQAMAALNLETPLPSLPSQLPVPIYVSPEPVMDMPLLYSYASTSRGE